MFSNANFVQKRWLVADPISSEIKLKFPEYHPAIIQILWNRGLRTQEEIDLFLSPDWSRDVHSPWIFLQMKDAVQNIFHSLENNEIITVHGDYDADGVSGSVVLLSTLREICRVLNYDEKKLNVFLPHREKDGYGLSLKTIEHLHANEKTNLLITVDCGISNHDAIARAYELGMSVIVCDHHQMPEKLPKQAVLLHPLIPGESYPNKKLCGTGVAFKLACALIEETRKKNSIAFPEGYEKWLLDLVAIATVTDVMPLQNENRVLEKFGLLVLNKTKRLGLQALLQVAGISEKTLDTWSIGFQIGPRLNAAGRMNHANAAFNLLMCENAEEAEQLALALNTSNTERQKASEEVYQKAKEQIGEKGERKILFAVGENWPVGLIGLVAGKISNEYGVPAFVISKTEDNTFTGSGRSLYGFDVTAAMKKASQVLLRFGGHPQACGMSCTGEVELQAFQKIMETEAESYFQDHEAIPTLAIDAELDIASLDWSLMEALEELEPFGEAHPKPLFILKGGEIVSVDTVGSDAQHLRLSLRDFKSGRIGKMIGFRFGEWMQKLAIGDKIEVVFEVGVNEWNGRKEIQMRIVDIKKYA